MSDVAGPLLGKQLVMRYAERSASENSQDAASYSVISRELPLTIVGVLTGAIGGDQDIAATANATRLCALILGRLARLPLTARTP